MLLMVTDGNFEESDDFYEGSVKHRIRVKHLLSTCPMLTWTYTGREPPIFLCADSGGTPTAFDMRVARTECKSTAIARSRFWTSTRRPTAPSTCWKTLRSEKGSKSSRESPSAPFLHFTPAPALTPPRRCRSNWPTIPQLYVNGEFIGGCDIMMEMNASGELKKLLLEAGAVAQ